jgi:hypothetical protein
MQEQVVIVLRNARAAARFYYVAVLTMSAFGALVLDGSCVSVTKAVPRHRRLCVLRGGGEQVDTSPVCLSGRVQSASTASILSLKKTDQDAQQGTSVASDYDTDHRLSEEFPELHVARERLLNDLENDSESFEEDDSENAGPHTTSADVETEALTDDATKDATDAPAPHSLADMLDGGSASALRHAALRYGRFLPPFQSISPPAPRVR